MFNDVQADNISSIYIKYKRNILTVFSNLIELLKITKPYKNCYYTKRKLNFEVVDFSLWEKFNYSISSLEKCMEFIKMQLYTRGCSGGTLSNK